jgi:hypothetical protein
VKTRGSFYTASAHLRQTVAILRRTPGRSPFYELDAGRDLGEVAGLKNDWVAVDPKRKVVATDSMSRIDVWRT